MSSAAQPAVAADGGPGVEPGRRGEILSAAAVVFAERGYDAGSMRAIAERVGVTEPALYRHFDSKEALFLALVRETAERARDDVLALVDQVRPDALRSGALAIIADRRRALNELAPVLRTILSSAPHHPRIRAELHEVLGGHVFERLVAKAAEVDSALGVTGGEATRRERVRALIALLFGYVVTSAWLGDEPDSAAVDALLRVMGWEAA